MKELFLIATFAIIGLSPIAFAEISVHRDLTPEEQQVLDGIAKARADGTYIQPPEAAGELLDINNFETKLDPSIPRPVS